ncbi:MAG: methyltransferase domain-containing protein [Candidatus Omnitrophica bacterium]|nr:methyltransferase domain-containing protein [Candidatus Omnitrophota bacterium]
MLSIAKSLKRLLPKRIRSVLVKLWIGILKLFGKDLDYFYGEDFAGMSEFRNKEWAGEFAEIIIKSFDPASVIDVGCGTADILRPFQDKDVKVLGVDGSGANKRHSRISPENFVLHDLRKGYDPQEKFDLCLCLEVAEHIEEKFSDKLIDTLTASSDTVIFTAAPPGQEGKNHVNLKPKRWWLEKFRSRGFALDEETTAQVKSQMERVPGVHWWYIQNLMVFKKTVNG